MKPDIHPKYYPNARVMCACGHTWTTGATLPEIRVDVCSNCHPFFTGEQRIVDTAGRVDRFRMRLLQKREKKVEKPRKEKFLVVGPDDEVKAEVPARVAVRASVVAAEPAAAAEPVAELAAAPAPAEAREEVDSVMVRTVVEGSDEVLSDDDARSRRSPTRKARPPKAEGETARKPRARKPETAEKDATPEADAAPEAAATEATAEPAESSGS
jgi:large subunit ribosomal protein L31